MAAIRIQPARADDIPRLAEWMVAFVRELRSLSADPYLAAAPPLPAAAWAVRFRNSVVVADRFLLVASVDGDPAGFVWANEVLPFIPDSSVGAVGRIEACWVVPAHRKRGVARALVSALETELARRGVRFVEANWLMDNPDAGHAWAALGFAPCRTLVRKALPGERTPHG